MMENQDNDDSIDPITLLDSDKGKPPHFVNEEDLPQFIQRSSGTVKIKCEAEGKPLAMRYMSQAAKHATPSKPNA